MSRWEEWMDPKAWGKRYGPNGEYDPDYHAEGPGTPYKPSGGGGCCGCLVVFIVIVVILVILQRATYHPVIHTPLSLKG
jgi:hypothetical protein